MLYPVILPTVRSHQSMTGWKTEAWN